MAKRPISWLASTAADHKGIINTPEALVKNPKKKLHETMDEEALRAYMALQYLAFSWQYRRALAGDPREAIGLQRAREIFTRDVLYLREIGRLPEELEDLDPETTFQLPKKE